MKTTRLLLPLLALLSAAPPARSASPRRICEWIDDSRTTLQNPASLRREALACAPRGFGTNGMEAQLSVPWTAGGQTRVHGSLTWNGVRVAGSDLWLVFDENGRLFFADRPAWSVESLAGPPGNVRFGPAEAAEIAQAFAGPDRAVQVDPVTFSFEIGRLYYPVLITPRLEDLDAAGAADPKAWELISLLVDATSGEAFGASRVSLHSELVGRCAGSGTPLAGPGIRRPLSPENPAVERGQRYIPLKLTHPLLPASPMTLTGAEGGFRLDVPPDGIWGLETCFDTDDFTFVKVPAVATVEAKVIGSGGAETRVGINAGPLVTLDDYNRAGFIAGWELLSSVRIYVNEIRERNGIHWARGVGGHEFIRGLAAEYDILYFRLPSPPGTAPLGGAYADWIRPPRIAISEGNDLFADWATPPVAAHEYGHALVGSSTGQDTRGPYPNGHDLAFNEAVADVLAFAYIERNDPGGEPAGLIGLGMDRDCPDCFQRDLRTGRACFAGDDATEDCRPVGGFGVYPVEGEPHLAGMPLSGFFYDLRRLLVEKRGLEAGQARLEDLLVAFLDAYRGGLIPPIDFWTIPKLLMADDNPNLGGNNNPHDRSPSWDLITYAAAAHNLWLFPFIRGDADASGGVDLGDAVRILAYLFLGQGEPTCLDAADADDNSAINLADAVLILGFLFLGGPPLPAPRACGIDPTPYDRLTCGSSSVCVSS